MDYDGIKLTQEVFCLRLPRFIPEGMGFPLISALLWNQLVYCGSRFLMKDAFHYDFTTWLDLKIPVIPWTLSVYLGCYLFWTIQYILCAGLEKEQAYRFFSADFLAKAICLFFFILVPTTNLRPVIQAHDFWSQGLIRLYQIDAADNLFPSIHCLVSWLCFIGVRNQSRFPKAYRVFSFFMAAAVCISTLTTRQHVLVDVAGGILAAEFGWHAVHKTGFDRLYGRLFSSLFRPAGSSGS